MVDTRVVVAMSGGVDSSVTAAVLKQQGYDVIGIGLKLVDQAGSESRAKSCCGIREMEDARRVAETIGIHFYVLNFTELFREHVMDYFASSYLRGETPNPCIPCNEVIKFDELLHKAREMGANLLATGHYAILEQDEETGRKVLKRGTDSTKDQSYFLYSLSQEQLSHALFPIGGIEKSETRRIAKELGLKVHKKVESQDVCFVDDRGYASFISDHTGQGAEPGPILDEEGSVIGTHKGLYHYTIGQRRGLGVSFAEPMYVVEIDPGENSITVAPGDRLSRQNRVYLDSMNYVSIARPGEPLEVECVTRYRKPAVEARLVPVDDKRAFIEFADPQEPTAPGQSVVMYREDTVLCGGIARENTEERA